MAAQMPPPPGAAPAADDSLARWVADLRQAGGPANRAVGAGPLRDASRARAASRPRGPELSAVEDLTAARDVRARLYRPARDPRPLTLYLHGGGFVVGDLESHDAICRRLAQAADTAVLAVDYRRAPEHPGPAAVEDAVAVYEWALDH
ncbi:MAG TPA: alpha/beta hydrolase fold domain-containing protein, partial [Streptosporangiaceae bacterium]|nr:alpha/beta hydrolase fold domain-containing protein [Streptosporangiaceae bacterium]